MPDNISDNIKGTIPSKGKTSIHIEQSINGSPNEEGEVDFVPDNFQKLVIKTRICGAPIPGALPICAVFIINSQIVPIFAWGFEASRDTG